MLSVGSRVSRRIAWRQLCHCGRKCTKHRPHVQFLCSRSDVYCNSCIDGNESLVSLNISSEKKRSCAAWEFLRKSNGEVAQIPIVKCVSHFHNTSESGKLAVFRITDGRETRGDEQMTIHKILFEQPSVGVGKIRLSL
eukprot:3137742-Amphidinium_carterae.1